MRAQHSKTQTNAVFCYFINVEREYNSKSKRTTELEVWEKGKNDLRVLTEPHFCLFCSYRFHHEEKHIRLTASMIQEVLLWRLHTDTYLGSFSEARSLRNLISCSYYIYMTGAKKSFEKAAKSKYLEIKHTLNP
jgi:hypothetical protein